MLGRVRLGSNCCAEITAESAQLKGVRLGPKFEPRLSGGRLAKYPLFI